MLSHESNGLWCWSHNQITESHERPSSSRAGDTSFFFPGSLRGGSCYVFLSLVQAMRDGFQRWLWGVGSFLIFSKPDDTSITNSPADLVTCTSFPSPWPLVFSHQAPQSFDFNKILFNLFPFEAVLSKNLCCLSLMCAISLQMKKQIQSEINQKLIKPWIYTFF